MGNKEIPIELAYSLGGNSRALGIFFESLLVGWEESGILRSPETMLEYKKHYTLNGSEGVAEVVREKMDGAEIALVDNIFPYDAHFPEGEKLLHMCLWSQNGEIEFDQVREIFTREFPNCSAIVFVNKQEYQTVPGMWHAHVVVDVGN